MWGDISTLLKREHQKPGCCIACDEPLPKKAPGTTGRPRTLLCGKRACLNTFYELRRSMLREMKELGIRAELSGARAAVERANAYLEKMKIGSGP